MRITGFKTNLLVACLLASSSIWAQSDPYFSHYMFNPSSFNPGAMGEATLAYTSFQHRSQWAGYSTTFDGAGGAPTSQLVTFISPVNGKISALGSNISIDSQGPQTTLNVKIGAAYNVNLTNGVISIGVMPSLVSRTVDFSQFRFETPGDPFDTGIKETQTKPDLSAGIFYKNFNGFFGGVSVDHVLSPSLLQIQTAGQQINGQLLPTYYFFSGKVLSVSRDMDITPTFLVKSDLTGFTIDISGIATYKNIMWGGVSLRRAEAIVALVGYNFLEDGKLKVGYSFDYVLKDQEAKKPSSHEIYVRYNLPSFVIGGRKAVKTPRFSF